MHHIFSDHRSIHTHLGWGMSPDGNWNWPTEVSKSYNSRHECLLVQQVLDIHSQPLLSSVFSVYNYTCYLISLDGTLFKKILLPLFMPCYPHFPTISQLSLAKHVEFFSLFSTSSALGLQDRWSLLTGVVPAVRTCCWHSFSSPPCACASQRPFGSPCSSGFMFTGRFLSLVHSLWAP